MAIPKYDELYPDFLTALISGAPRPIGDIRQEIAQRRQLTEEELRLPLNSQSTTVFASRVKLGRRLSPQGGPDRPSEQRYLPNYRSWKAGHSPDRAAHRQLLSDALHRLPGLLQFYPERH